MLPSASPREGPNVLTRASLYLIGRQLEQRRFYNYGEDHLMFPAGGGDITHLAAAWRYNLQITDTG